MLHITPRKQELRRHNRLTKRVWPLCSGVGSEVPKLPEVYFAVNAMRLREPFVFMAALLNCEIYLLPEVYLAVFNFMAALSNCVMDIACPIGIPTASASLRLSHHPLAQHQQAQSLQWPLMAINWPLMAIHGH